MIFMIHVFIKDYSFDTSYVCDVITVCREMQLCGRQCIVQPLSIIFTRMERLPIRQTVTCIRIEVLKYYHQSVHRYL